MEFKNTVCVSKKKKRTENANTEMQICNNSTNKTNFPILTGVQLALSLWQVFCFEHATCFWFKFVISDNNTERPL